MTRATMRVAFLVCALALCGASRGACAQSMAAKPLGGAPTEFATTFSSIYHLAELADGRVVLFDALERRLGVADFARGSFADIARQGAGPLEYRNVHAIHRVSGDTLLLWDPSNDRILAFAPDARHLACGRSRVVMRGAPRSHARCQQRSMARGVGTCRSGP